MDLLQGPESVQKPPALAWWKERSSPWEKWRSWEQWTWFFWQKQIEKHGVPIKTMMFFFCTNQCDGLWWLFDVTRNSIIWDTLSVIPSIYPSKWKYMKVIFWEEVIWGSNNYPVKSILWLTNIVTWNEQDISCKLEGSLWQLYHSKLKSLLERRSLAIQNGKTRLTTGLDKQPRILLGFWDPMCEFGGQSDQSTILY